jgi:hypothetical protein
LFGGAGRQQVWKAVVLQEAVDTRVLVPTSKGPFLVNTDDIARQLPRTKVEGHARFLLVMPGTVTDSVWLHGMFGKLFGPLAGKPILLLL